MKIQWSSILAVLLLIPILGGSSVFASSAAPAAVDQQIRHELLMLPNYGVFDWLECEIRPDNSAVLRGRVTRPSVKSDAETVLRRVEGIAKVENQIEVLPISTHDDQLRIALYRSMFRYDGPLFRYAIQAAPPIHIVVNNGRVALKGLVDDIGDRQIAGSVANGTTGVFEVSNELKVAGR